MTTTRRFAKIGRTGLLRAATGGAASLALVAGGTTLPPAVGQTVTAVPAKDCSDAAFQADKAKLKTVEVKEGGAQRILFVYQGDILVPSAQLEAMWHASCRRDAAPVATVEGKQVELKVMLNASGGRAIWPLDNRKLTYAVDRKTFPNDDWYKMAVTAATKAAAEWQAICPACGLTLTHRADLDRRRPRIAAGTPGPDEVTFVIGYLPKPSDPRLIASAFFPNDPPSRRHLYVTPAFYTTSFPRQGVLRHELGHVLAYRHEHVGVADCPREDFNWEAAGPYTRNSVMHYPCAGAGSSDLAIVEADKDQHRIVYRLP